MPRDYDAFVLAHTYGYCPLPDGKYEPGDCADPDLRWMILGNARDHTAIYVKYDLLELEP